MKPLWLFILCSALSLGSIPPGTLAQGYGVGWSTLDGGGGTSTGGVYALSGTLGQPDAGRMTGGGYELDGGFWGIIAALQTPGAPLLSIALDPQLSTVTVSWPSSATDWTLQMNGSLTATNWLNFSGPVSDDGTNKSVTLSPATGDQLYRLQK